MLLRLRSFFRARPVSVVSLSTAVLLAFSAAGTLTAGCGGTGAAAPSLTSPGLAGNNGAGGAGKAAAGTETAASTSTAGRIGVFITDSFTEDYEHVWGTIHKVELLDDQEKAETIFEDQEGVTLDLKSLRDFSGPRYALLTSASVTSAKAHKRVRVTMGKAFQLYAPGQTVAKTAPVAESVTRDEEGRPVVSYALEQPHNLGSGQDYLVIDFDLAKFTVADDQVTPVLAEGKKTGLEDRARQESREFEGVVSELAGEAPEGTFLLTTKSGRTLHVRTDSATALFNDEAKPNPAMANSKRVQVRGTFDLSSKRLMAAQVKVFESAEANDAVSEVRGGVSSINGDAGTFVIATGQVTGLTPTQSAVTVTVAPDAVLRSRGGLPLSRADFFKALAAKNALAEVEGTFDPVSSALTATRARIEEATPSESHEAEIKGAPTAIKGDDGKFSVTTLSAWEGIAAPSEGKGIPVVTTAATAFGDTEGKFIASATFFTAIGDGSKDVQVTGLYSKGVLTATRIELRPAAPKPAPAAVKPEGEPAAAKGETAEAKKDAKPEEKTKPETTPGEKPKA